MKFLVECTCDLYKTIHDFGMHGDFVDLKMTAPSARIAEYKVMSRHPSVKWCEVKLLQKEKRENIRDIRAFCIAYCFIAVPAFYLLGFSHTPIDLPLRTITAALSPLVISPFLCLAIYLVDGEHNRERERIAALERECFRRMGYRKGWADRDRGGSPEFVEWEKEEQSETWPE